MNVIPAIRKEIFLTCSKCKSGFNPGEKPKIFGPIPIPAGDGVSLFFPEPFSMCKKCFDDSQSRNLSVYNVESPASTQTEGQRT